MSESWTKSTEPCGILGQSRDKHPDYGEDGRMNGFQSLQLPLGGLCEREVGPNPKQEPGRCMLPTVIEAGP